MNILITGANGQLGNAMRIWDCHNSTRTDGASFRFIYTDVTDASAESIGMLHKLAGNDVNTQTAKLDITDIEAVRSFVRENQVDVIINCAAWTNVDGAEDPANRAVVERLNAQAPQNLANVMKEAGGLLLHISTDYVFGGDPYNTPCREDQQGTPTGVYGLTKLQGEQNIQASGCKYVILRTAWLYSEFGKNFVKTMLGLTATRPQLKVVFDQVGTPTYAQDLAQAIGTIIEDYDEWGSRFKVQGSRLPQGESTPDSLILNPNLREQQEQNLKPETCNLKPETWPKAGIFHFSNEGVCSWYDFARMIAAYSGHRGCDIQPCHSSEFPSPVARPAYSVLDKTRFKTVFHSTIPYWTHSLQRCIKNLNY